MFIFCIPIMDRTFLCLPAIGRVYGCTTALIYHLELLVRSACGDDILEEGTSLDGFGADKAWSLSLSMAWLVMVDGMVIVVGNGFFHRKCPKRTDFVLSRYHKPLKALMWIQDNMDEGKKGKREYLRGKKSNTNTRTVCVDSTHWSSVSITIDPSDILIYQDGVCLSDSKAITLLIALDEKYFHILRLSLWFIRSVPTNNNTATQDRANLALIKDQLCLTMSSTVYHT